MSDSRAWCTPPLTNACHPLLPQAPAPFTAPKDTAPLDFEVRFEGMVYATLVADAAKEANFKDDVKSQVGLAAGLSSVQQCYRN